MRGRFPTGASSVVDVLVRVLVDRSRRISALIVIAYVSGIGGLALSFFGDISDPSTGLTTAGIVLMSISFVSLFVLSITMVELAPDDRR